jgi:hypothetical protein
MEDNKTANLPTKHKPMVYGNGGGQWKEQEIDWRRNRFVSLIHKEEKEEAEEEYVYIYMMRVNQLIQKFGRGDISEYTHRHVDKVIL